PLCSSSAGSSVKCGGTLLFYSFASAKVLRLLSCCCRFVYDSLRSRKLFGFSVVPAQKKRPLLRKRPPNVNKPPSTVFPQTGRTACSLLRAVLARSIYFALDCF